MKRKVIRMEVTLKASYDADPNWYENADDNPWTMARIDQENFRKNIDILLDLCDDEDVKIEVIPIYEEEINEN